MPTTSVTDKGSVTIPPELRNRYGLRAGTRVHIVDYGQILSLVPSTSDPIGASYSMFKGSSLTRTLLALRSARADDRGPANGRGRN